MLTLYTALLSLHIIAAVLWIGGGSFLQIVMGRMHSQRDTVALGGLLQHSQFLGNVFAGSSVLLIATGFGLVAKGDWEFELWIILALVAWLGAALDGALNLGRQSEKVGQLLAAGNADPQEIDRRMRLVLISGRIELVILLLVIVDMVVKPGT